MAPHAETAGQVQGIHRLGLELPKHGPAHGLQLLVQLLTELWAGVGRIVTGVLGRKRVSLRRFALAIQPDVQSRSLGDSSAFGRKETPTLCKEGRRPLCPVLLSRPASGVLGSSLSSKYSSLQPIYASPRLLGPPHLPLHFVQPLTLLTPNPEGDSQGHPPSSPVWRWGVAGKPTFYLIIYDPFHYKND